MWQVNEWGRERHRIVVSNGSTFRSIGKKLGSIERINNTKDNVIVCLEFNVGEFLLQIMMVFYFYINFHYAYL